jgi:FkbM family methyltransferase
MNSINETIANYTERAIDKQTFIRRMYEQHHAALFDYAAHLKRTNVAAIEIADDTVTMTSRDRGVRMVCPLADQRVAPIEMLNFSDYEAIDSTMIMRLVSPGDSVFDIGANMGWYSINIAKSFPSTKVHAFEPIPKTYSFLERNIKINGVTNVVAHHFGLSNENRELTFYFYPEGSGNASSANLSERIDAELVTCRVERLDDFVRANDLTVDFIKCDVEGAELFAFQGATATLQRDKPIVFTEMLRKWAAKFNYHPNEIIALFSSLGYGCYVAAESKLRQFFEMDEATAETNFFFLHIEKHQGLINELSH